ncbi:hypothetical protein, partial [Roseateles chitinivorans]|uniref:hypothetical protein n=1 Tax=Roseateles chitinivorans TaxID=2917965 RepID=UPI0018ED1968
AYKLAFGNLSNDPLAEQILASLARDSGVSMDARGTAAYDDHTKNTELLNTTIGSYKLAAQTPSGGIEQANGTWLGTEPGKLPMPNGARTQTSFPVPGCNAPAGACTYTFIFGSDLAYVQVPQADGSYQLYEANKEQQTTLAAQQAKYYVDGIKSAPGKAWDAGVALGKEALAYGKDLTVGNLSNAANALNGLNNAMTGAAAAGPQGASAALNVGLPSTYESKTMQWYVSDKPLDITATDVTKFVVDLAPISVFMNQVGKVSSHDPEQIKSAGEEATWTVAGAVGAKAAEVALSAGSKLTNKVLEEIEVRVSAKAEAEAAEAAAAADKLPETVDATKTGTGASTSKTTDSAETRGTAPAEQATPDSTTGKAAEDAAAAGCLAPPNCFVAGTLV